jgi:hypothetical protein
MDLQSFYEKVASYQNPHFTQETTAYFLSLRKSPSEATQLCYQVLTDLTRGDDSNLIAAQLLVHVASTGAVPQILQIACGILNSRIYAGDTPVHRQLALVVASSVLGHLVASKKTQHEDVLAGSIMSGLQVNIQNRNLLIEVIGLLPEILSSPKNRALVPADLHSVVCKQVLEVDYNTYHALNEKGEEGLEAMCRIVQCTANWAEFARTTDNSSEAGLEIISMWLNCAMVKWSIGILHDPLWVGSYCLRTIGETQQQQQIYYRESFELFSTICSILGSCPSTAALLLYMEKGLSLVTAIVRATAMMAMEKNNKGDVTSIVELSCGCAVDLFDAVFKSSPHGHSHVALIQACFDHFQRFVTTCQEIVSNLPKCCETLNLVSNITDVCANFCDSLFFNQKVLSGIVHVGSLKETENVIGKVMEIAIYYSHIDDHTGTVRFDPSSKINLKYDQDEGGDFRKSLRDTLRSCCKVLPGLNVCILEALKGAIQSVHQWPQVEIYLHAMSAISKMLSIEMTMELVMIVTTSAEVAANRALCRFAVVLLGDCMSKIMKADITESHVHVRNNLINRSFCFIASSFMHVEEAPIRVVGVALTIGGHFAFRLKEDHIGIVSLARILQLLPVYQNQLHFDVFESMGGTRLFILAPEVLKHARVVDIATSEDVDIGVILVRAVSSYWVLLNDCMFNAAEPFMNTTFKSFLVATEGMASTLFKYGLEKYILVPLVGALLVAIHANNEMILSLVSGLSFSDIECIQSKSALGRLSVSQLMTAISCCLQAFARTARSSPVHNHEIVELLTRLVSVVQYFLSSYVLQPANLSMFTQLLMESGLLLSSSCSGQSEPPLSVYQDLVTISCDVQNIILECNFEESFVHIMKLWCMWVVAHFGRQINHYNLAHLIDTARFIAKSACGYLIRSSSQHALLVSPSSAIQRTLFELLLAINQASRLFPSILDDEMQVKVARAVLIGLVSRECSNERDCAFEVLQNIFQQSGAKHAMALLEAALNLEPRVLPVGNKGVHKAFEALGKAADRGDWKKFRSSARQLKSN